MNFLPSDLVNRIHDNPLEDWSRFQGSLGNVSNPHPQDIWGPTDEGGNYRQQALDPNVWGGDGRLRPEIQARLMRGGVQYEPFSGQGVLDQNRVQFDPEFGLITHQGNNRPVPSGGIWDWLPMVAAALPMAAVAGAGLGAVGAGEAGGLTLGAGSGATAGAGAGFAAEGALGGAFAGGAGAAAGSGAGGAGGYAPVTDLSTAAGNYAPVTDLSTGGGLMGQASQMGSGLLTSAMNNPLQALGAVQSASGLLGGNRGASGGSGGSGKSSSGTGMNVSRPNYTPNPFLMAQLQRGR